MGERDPKWKKLRDIPIPKEYDNRMWDVSDYPNINDLFYVTDVLITDYSSIILEFFLSGKPVIYCAKTNINFSETYKQMIRGCYIAENWEQTETIVQKLRNGEDELKTVRTNIIENIKKQHIGATERIVNFLINDAYRP